MKIRMIALVVVISLFLGGCGWLDGSYVSVTPHQEQSGSIRSENLTVSNYEELLNVLENVVSKGTETCVINVVNYQQDYLELNVANAVQRIQKVYPVGAYAVESVKYEIGSNTGKTAIAVEIAYRHSRNEIRNIRKAQDTEAARKYVGQTLESFDTVLVMELDTYEELDYVQVVQEYALENPQSVMEIPQVTWEAYGIGTSRVVELTFFYQTNRDALRTMQTQVQPVFDSAVLYVSGEGAQHQKYAQLYAFLMERFDYKLETSITPAYSLLRHGVGDSRAFATVYAAMCRDAGLECMVVTGTRNGEPRIWNIIRSEDAYYHVDLLQCEEAGRFQEMLDSEMGGYVWDYSAYPACVIREEEAADAEEEIFLTENEINT